jgi:hypothetical protein
VAVCRALLADCFLKGCMQGAPACKGRLHARGACMQGAPACKGRLHAQDPSRDGLQHPGACMRVAGAAGG